MEGEEKEEKTKKGKTEEKKGKTGEEREDRGEEREDRGEEREDRGEEREDSKKKGKRKRKRIVHFCGLTFGSSLVQKQETLMNEVSSRFWSCVFLSRFFCLFFKCCEELG